MKNKCLSILLGFCFIFPCMFILSACGNTEPKYQITIGEFNNGVITANKTTAYEGDTIYLTINANEGYELEANSLKYNGITISNYSFTMPDEDVVITANFVVETFEINYHIDEFTTHTNPTSATADDVINLTDPIKSGYDFDGWYYDSTFNNKVQGTISNLDNNLNLYPKFNQLFIVQSSGYITALTDYAKQKTKLTIPAVVDGINIYEIYLYDEYNNNEDYENLEELTIESGITHLSTYSFPNCANLKKVTLPNTLSVGVLPFKWFNGCSKLETIIVENQNKEENGLYSENNVLYYKRSGTKFDPSQGGSVAYTDIYMVCYPSGLTNETYTVPEGVTYLYGFGNAKFKNLEISSTVEQISNLASCTQIENITVNANNTLFLTQDDCLYYKSSNASYTLALYYGESTTLIMPSSIQIGNVITSISSIEETALINSNVTSIISDISAADIYVDIFEYLPNLKFFSLEEKPVPSNWNEEDIYRDVLHCENIYWYLETEPTEEGQYWHYSNDGVTPVIW